MRPQETMSHIVPDVSPITGVQVLERQNVLSPDYIEPLYFFNQFFQENFSRTTPLLGDFMVL